MSRGFGTNFGGANGDAIALGSTTITTQHSLAIWFYCHGSGQSGFGCPWYAYTEIFMNNSATSMLVSEPFSTTGGQFSWTTKSAVWQHLLYTFDGSSTSNKPAVYINGVSVSVTTNTTPSGTFSPSNVTWCLGNNGSGAGHTWDGMLAHFAYWPNTLLTAGEALALGSGASPLLIRPDSLGYYLPLDGVNNPEFNFAGKLYAVHGTALGSSDPPAESVANVFTPGLLDMSINTMNLLPWRRPGLTYRRITA